MQQRVLVTGGSGFIGTNLLTYLAHKGYLIASLDRVPPTRSEHRKYWKGLDLGDAPSLQSALTEFSPDIIVHLAARTDLNGASINDYSDNIHATRNLLDASENVKSIKKIIFASTQMVVRAGICPEGETFFLPDTNYGESKVLMEKMIRERNLSYDWHIIRPTNVWGPYHPFLPDGILKFIRDGRYVHPAGMPIIKAYCYIDSLCEQICRMAKLASEKHGSVFYLSNEPIDSYCWVNAFSIKITGDQVRKVPKVLMNIIANAGSVLKPIGLKSPLSTDRYRRITTSDCVPLYNTTQAIGAVPFRLDDGVQIMVDWLLSTHGPWRDWQFQRKHAPELAPQSRDRHR